MRTRQMPREDLAPCYLHHLHNSLFSRPPHRESSCRLPCGSARCVTPVCFRGWQLTYHSAISPIGNLWPYFVSYIQPGPQICRLHPHVSNVLHLALLSPWHSAGGTMAKTGNDVFNPNSVHFAAEQKQFTAKCASPLDLEI